MSRVYKGVIGVCDKFVPGKLRPLWDHPAGPKTIFFWAPLFKWGLVIAGLGDINRPVENLSIPQTTSLLFTGLIWSRYSVALVFTSLDQFRAPIETVSTSQSASLAATGLIWTRFCLTITPINYSLSICNFMLGVANGTQCFRAVRYQYAQKALTQGESTENVKTKEL